MRRFSLLLSATILTLGSGAVRAETLEQGVIDALNQHPSVQAALVERDLARAQEREKYSDYFPQLNANAGAGRVYGDNATSRGLSTTRGAGYSYLGEGSVSLRETLFDADQTGSNVAAARQRIASATSNIADVRENLTLRVVLSYLDVLRARDSVEAIETHAKKIRSYRGRIDKMVADGGADRSMTVQAHDIQNQLDSTLADVEGQKDKALADYAEAVGHPALEPFVRPALLTDYILADADAAVKLAQQDHPALRSALLQDQAAGYDTEAEKGKLYPGVTGELSYYKKNVDEIIGGDVDDGRAVVRMNWDFATGGAQMAKIRQSKERQAQARAQAADLRGRIEREIRKAYAELDASKKRFEVNQERAEVSKDLVGTYEKQFEGGKVTLLNLLQAENTDFNARLSFLNADYRYQAAEYSVLANTGHLQDALGVAPLGSFKPVAAHE